MKNALPTQCRFCNSQNLETRKGSGPHAAGIWCADCQRHQKWIGKSLAVQLGLLEVES